MCYTFLIIGEIQKIYMIYFSHFWGKSFITKNLTHIFNLPIYIIVVDVFTFKIVKQLEPQHCSLHQARGLNLVR